MSLVINDNPVSYASLHGDLLFTVYNATNVSNTGYKYVCDIYIDSVLVARTKAFPNPTHLRGVFNIGPVVRNYITTQLNLTIPTTIQTQQMGSGEFYVDVVCKFGEEYGGTLYTNLVVDSSRRFYNHFNGRLLDTETKLSSFVNKCPSNRPYLNSALYTSLFTEKFSFLPYFPETTSPYTVWVKTYLSDGTLQNENSDSFTPSGSKVLQILDVSPAGLCSVFEGVIDTDTAYYIVKVGPTEETASVYRFDIVCEPKYTARSIHFLNQYGGFESVVFSKISRKNIEVEKKDFKQLPYRVNSSGVVSYYQSQVLHDTRTVYASKFREKQIFNSDFMSDEGYQWLKELIVSPIVYLEESGYLVPVTIVETSYEEKKVVNDKLTSLSITVEFGEQYNAQYR
jgi:hypothetical protein